MEEDKVIKLIDVRDNLSCIMTVIASGDYSCDITADIICAQLWQMIVSQLLRK